MSDDQTQERGPDGSPPGHIEKMRGRARETQGGDDNTADPSGSDGQVAQRPDDVPEKFWDAEKGEVNTAALLKAQADAEAALRQKQGDDDSQNDSESGDDENTDETPTQSSVVADASNEWAEKGELSEGTLKNLEGVGISREMVAQYIQGQQAVISNLQSAAYGPFEGKEGYDEAANWAAQNLSEDEIKALDVQLTSNNPAIVKQGAQALAKRFAEEGDREPTTLRGGGNGGETGTVYRSRAEMIRDMRDPRYRKDAAFRKAVEDKLRRSKLGK